MSVTTPASALLSPVNTTTAESILVVHEGTVGLWGPKRDPLWVVIPVTVYYAIVLVSGVVGNVSTCVVIARNKHMHTATNYYLLTLPLSCCSLVVHEGIVGLWGPKRDPLWVVIPVTVYYAIVLVSGVVGNVSTCVVIARNKHMHTATNYYLFSLAISDLLLLLSGLPQEMYHIWSNYPYVFGETFCILAGLASETSTNATVLTITAFTVERYVAICHPFLSHTVSKLSRAVKFIMAIWTMSFCLAVPQAIQMGLVYLRDDNGDIISEEYKSCTLKHSIAPSSFFVSTVVFFLAPMTLITALYVLIGVRLHRSSQITQGGGAGVPTQRRRRRTLLVGSRDKETTIIVRGSQRNGPHSKSTKRVVKMLVSVVVAFFICWAPFQVQRLYAIYGFAGDNTTSTDILVYKVMTYASGLLYYLSTTINPILYNIMSLKFRQAFKSTLTKCLGQELRRSGEMSSGGGGGGSQGAGRLKFAVSRGNNNSGSSGSYAEAGDLSRRPLVVSFRRRSPRTSSTSLDRRCCELPPPYRAPELMDVPEVSNSPSTDDCALRPHLRPCAPPPYSAPDLTLPRHCPPLTSTAVPREPRVEDIEIFHECQLRILESVRTRRKEEPMCAVAVRREDQGEGGQGQDPLKYVRKSLTDPCLTMH